MAPLDLQLKAESWLHTLGCTPVPQEDPQAAWHFLVDYPVRSPHPMHVVGPKGQPNALVIASATTISREHYQTFEGLDADDKGDFLWELRRTLNHTEVDFQLEGVKNILDCPSMFQVSVTRYSDGLSMDSFARSMSMVFHTELNAMWLVQRYLQPGAGGSGGRFDFRRAG